MTKLCQQHYDGLRWKQIYDEAHQDCCTRGGRELVLGSLPMMSGCLHAYHERSKVSIGMSVADVFNVIGEWNFCLSTYRDADTKEFGTFDILKEPDEPTYRVKQGDETINSKEELLQFVEKRMSNGKAWSCQFTYLAGPIRNTFRVDFDRNGKVINVSGMGGGP